MMYNIMPASIGPGMDPLSFLVISSKIDLVHSVSIHSNAKNSALWDANANKANQKCNITQHINMKIYDKNNVNLFTNNSYSKKTRTKTNDKRI